MNDNNNSDKKISTQRLIQIQAVTGVGIGAFTTVHLLNLTTAISGPMFYDEAQAIFRLVYQIPAVEVLLLGSIVTHAVCSVIIVRRRRRNILDDLRFIGPDSWSFYKKLHRGSGYFLLGVLGAHILATRIYPDFIGDFPIEKSGLLADSMVGVGFCLFLPYYWLLGCAGFSHTAIGMYHAKRILWPSKEQTSEPPTKYFNPLLAVGVTLVTVSVLAVASPSFHALAARTSTTDSIKSLWQSAVDWVKK